MAMKIKKGDRVIVITGKCKGKVGDVSKVLTKDNKVVVAGVNMVKKHQKPTADTPGRIVEIEKALDISNVSLIDDGKPAKVGFRINGDGKKIRFFKKSGKEVDK